MTPNVAVKAKKFSKMAEIPKIGITGANLDENRNARVLKSPSVLYEDEFCKVTNTELIVKNCNFWAMNKTIPLNKIRRIYYANQNLTEHILMRRSRSSSCRRPQQSPLFPRKSSKSNAFLKSPIPSRRSPSTKNQNLDLYDFLWARTPELLAYYSSGCTNGKSLYSISVDLGKKMIGFAVAKPENFLDLIRVLLPYQIVIQNRCISEISPKAYRMILAGSAVCINSSM